MLYELRQAISDAAVNLRTKVLPRAKISGVSLPIDERISLPLRRMILDGSYERNELDIVERTLSKSDRVLECGAGIGLLSAYCAKRLGNEPVRTFEANPYMAPIIQSTFELNEVTPMLINGAIGAGRGEMEFHVRKNFYASSSHPGRVDGSMQTIRVTVHDLHDEVMNHRPTFLFIDIEGGEEGLAGCSSLPGVQKVMAEVHPDLIGQEGVRKFVSWLESLGFKKDFGISKEQELFFSRG